MKRKKYEIRWTYRESGREQIVAPSQEEVEKHVSGRNWDLRMDGDWEHEIAEITGERESKWLDDFEALMDEARDDKDAEKYVDSLIFELCQLLYCGSIDECAEHGDEIKSCHYGDAT